MTYSVRLTALTLALCALSCSPVDSLGEQPAEAAPAVRSASASLSAAGPLGIKRYRPPGILAAATPTCPNPKLTYRGGPLLQTPIIVPVFWNANVTAEVKANLPQFYADVTQSPYWTLLQEYDSVGLSGGKQAILPGTALPGVTVVPTLCPASKTTACTVTDAQVQTELIQQVGLGTLPAPALDCSGNVRTIYMVHFPANVRITLGGAASCVQFCAYHNTGLYGPSNTPLLYGVMPDEYTGGCASGCGNGTALQNTTSTAAHELAEAATDADIGLVPGNTVVAPGAWYDDTCGEIADICDSGGADTDVITVSGRSWTVQQLWSNAQKKCTSSSTALPICSGTTTTGCRKCSCDDNGVACSGSTPVCETNASNVLFGACEQCTALSNTCGAQSSCAQSTTPAQDDVCVCTPATTCPAGKNCGTIPNGCGGTIACGTCTGPQTCGGGGTSNVCGCTPVKACGAGANCGTIPDGCGGTVSCGPSCSGSQTCGGGGTSNVCGCTPVKTCGAGANCGTIPDGCGGTVSCGPSCSGSQTCGGGGSPNVCGCTPVKACAAGTNCGTIPDGCGGTVSCGPACGGTDTCGGGGSANVCGCTPVKACAAGTNCGSIPDGCGGTVSCGAACSGTDTCGGGGAANVCGCTPAKACAAGTNCGSIPDGCGGTVSCGAACSGTDTCGGGGSANVCGCTPVTTCAPGANCGTIPDGCGGSVSCGAPCAADQTCTQNQCVGLDAGGTSGADAGSTSSDAGSAAEDAGSAAEDGGSAVEDAGSIGSDAGAIASSTDAGTDGTGASTRGCGCQTTDLPSTAALVLLGLLVSRRRAAARG